MSEKLYEMQEQLMQIDNILAENTNPDTEEILETAREELLKAIDGKLENILDFISDCKSKADQLAAREEVFYKRRKALEKKVEYLKSLVFGEMKNRGETKSTYGDWNCSIAKTPARVVLDCLEDLVPEQFTKQIVQIDKTAIKEAMVDGVCKVGDMPIAHLEQGESLRIK